MLCWTIISAIFIAAKEQSPRRKKDLADERNEELVTNTAKDMNALTKPRLRIQTSLTSLSTITSLAIRINRPKPSPTLQYYIPFIYNRVQRINITYTF